MSILVDTIRISGFRGIANLEMSFSRVTVLIGANNSGKTSVIKALQLALGDYSRHLTEEDMHVGGDDLRVNEILVDVRIAPRGSDGSHALSFDEPWTREFGDKIQAVPNGQQFVALRARATLNPIRGGFDCKRYTLERWPASDAWATERIKETPMTMRFEVMPFISIDAQRDICDELKNKSSFVGKVLSSVKYNPTDIEALELIIKELNQEAVTKSGELIALARHLCDLNQSFQGSGNAEITPFPKKIRDLAKTFSVHFGESTDNSFSMEYHGMGTRSWASMLAVKAFTDLMATTHQNEETPFFPILAAEEPEAHLHPNAQKTIYGQLVESKGQVIISTHSPYLASMAEQHELRCLRNISSRIMPHQLSSILDDEHYRRIKREVIHSRGEILFCKALILCEGETEEQALPLLFHKHFGKEAFVLGVSFVGVGGSGSKYHPFLTLAKDFSIPVFIFSDGEDRTVSALKTTCDSIFGNTDVSDCKWITILEDTNFEGYLISAGFRSSIVDAISQLDGPDELSNWASKRHGNRAPRSKSSNPPCGTCNQPIYNFDTYDYKSYGGDDRALRDKLHSGKTRYAPAIAENLCKLDPLPPKVIEFFEKVRVGAEI